MSEPLRPMSHLSERELEAGPLARIPVAPDIVDGTYVAERLAELGPASTVPKRADLPHTLDLTRDFLTRYVAFASPEQADAAALWVGHTWTYDVFDTTPYLAIQSAERRSGKTRLLECLRLIVRQPLPVAGTSLAALFRVVNEKHPTLLLDEADALFNRRNSDAAEDIRGLLNNGYRRGTPYLRVVGEGKKMHVESFQVFCPKAIASIGTLPDTVQDRSLVVRLNRRASTEGVAPFRFRLAEQEALPIREWWESLADARLNEEAPVPKQLHDRAADNWEPLCALADAAAGEWPERARHAALALSGIVDVEEERPGIRLLSDIRIVLDARDGDRIATTSLLDELRGEGFAESGWEDWRGRGLKAEGLAYLLRPFGIRSRQMKVGGANVKGYEIASFADAFARYLPPPTTPLTVYPSTSERESEHEGRGVAGYEGVEGKAQKGDGALHHTCHDCHQPILDQSQTFVDAASSTFWHRACWHRPDRPIFVS